MRAKAGDSQNVAEPLAFHPATPRRIRILATLCLVLASVAVTLPVSRASGDGYWDTPFKDPQYLLHITETNGRPDDRYILWPVAPDGNRVVHTSDGSGGWVGHKADVAGGAFQTPRQVCEQATSVPLTKIPLNCSQLPNSKNCRIVCGQRFPHGAWDGRSEYPCDCVCELGWGFDDDGNCQTCDRLCNDKGVDHLIYDKRNQERGSCPCTCETGYTLKGERCEKVDCGDHAVNMADVQTPSSPALLVCPSERALDEHCCCRSGYLVWGGACVRQDEIPRKDESPERPPEPDRASCQQYGIAPEAFDLVYDQGLLALHFEDMLEAYKGPLWRGSKVVGDSLITTREFFFHLGYTDDAKFHTGREAELQARIAAAHAASGVPLTPAQVLEQSLALNEGRVFDALLTCHNLLRQDAYKHRDEQRYQHQLVRAQQQVQNAQTQQARDQARRNLANVQAQLAANKNIYPALQVIRTTRDNVGAWYHLFGTMTAGFGYGTVGVVSLTGEKAYRRDYSSDPDPLERCWDEWGAVLGWRLQDMVRIRYQGSLKPALGKDASAIRSGYQGSPPAGGGP